MQECPEYCRRGTPDFVRTKSIEIDVDEMAHPFPFFHPFIPYVKKDGERDFKNFRNFHSVMFQRGKSAGIGNNRCDGETRRRLVFIQHAEYLRYLFWQADLLLAFAQCRRDKILILIIHRAARKRNLPFVMLHVFCPFGEKHIQLAVFGIQKHQHGCLSEAGLPELLLLVAPEKFPYLFYREGHDGFQRCGEREMLCTTRAPEERADSTFSRTDLHSGDFMVSSGFDSSSYSNPFKEENVGPWNCLLAERTMRYPSRSL